MLRTEVQNKPAAPSKTCCNERPRCAACFFTLRDRGNAPPKTRGLSLCSIVATLPGGAWPALCLKTLKRRLPRPPFLLIFKKRGNPLRGFLPILYFHSSAHLVEGFVDDGCFVRACEDDESVASADYCVAVRHDFVVFACETYDKCALRKRKL